MTANRSLQNRFRPSVENLESRDVMSVTSVTLNAGVLRVELDNGNDNVQISESTLAFANSATAAASVASHGSSNLLPRTIKVTDATRTGVSWSFNRSAVKKIVVENHNSFGDANIINSNSSLPTVVDLRNSKGTNQVDTGAGNDTVFGSEGNDIIRTGAGNDMIAAGAGNDFIAAGLGSDSMFGGADNDTLVDVFSNTDANLLYGDAGNDTLLSFCKKDVVDGGTEIDSASVKTGTSIVRKVENVAIIDVPLGNAVTDTRLIPRQAANRFLQAHGLPKVTQAFVLNDSKSGLTSSSMLHVVRGVKPDATLVSNASRLTIANMLRTGKPVLAKAGNAWVVYNGYNAETKLFTFIAINGQQKTTPLDGADKRDMIY